MRSVVVLLGALLSSAPLFSQLPAAADPQVRDGRVSWFSLTETTNDVAGSLGRGALVAGFGQDLVAWQYQIGEVNHDDFSHQLVFRKSERALISITRNYEPERSVDDLFPRSETTVYSYPNAASPQFTLRFRRLSGGRAFLANGGLGKPTSQLILIREAEIRNFYPWLFEQLTGVLLSVTSF